jgi:hypothetical protein
MEKREMMTWGQELIEVRSTPEPNTGCWLWTGGLTGEGYGSAFGQLAHRISYEAHKGRIPHGLLVRHNCDQPSCVNPDHLIAGTHLQNMQDKTRRGRAAGAGKGAAHWKAILTDADVLAIIADARPQSVIAAQYGIRQQAVSKIKLKQTWAHLRKG